MDPAIISSGPSGTRDAHINSGTNNGQCSQWFLWGMNSALTYINYICNPLIKKLRATNSHIHLMDTRLVVPYRINIGCLATSTSLFLLVAFPFSVPQISGTSSLEIISMMGI